MFRKDPNLFLSNLDTSKSGTNIAVESHLSVNDIFWNNTLAARLSWNKNK